MWLWGCGFLAGLGCIGAFVVMLVAVPIGFRLLSPENQIRIANRLPIMRMFIPTREVAALPTLDAAKATDAARFFSTPTSAAGRAATATPTLFPTATFEPLPDTFRVKNAKWIAQKWNNCGPANLAQALNVINVPTTQEAAAAWLKPDANDSNVSPWQLVAFTQQFTAARALHRINGDIMLLKRLVYNGFGVVIETGYSDREDGQWEGHYLTVIGWNDGNGYLLGLDTLYNSDDPLGYHEPYADLLQRWQHFNYTYIVVYRPEQESRLREILGTAWDAQLNIDEALIRSLNEVQQQRENPFAWFNLGTNYTLVGRYSEAVNAYNLARTVGGGWPWRMLWYQFGPYMAYYQTGDYQTVINLTINTETNTKTIEETYYYRAFAYAATGALQQAMDELNRALTHNTNFTAAQEAINQLRNGQKPAPELQ